LEGAASVICDPMDTPITIMAKQNNGALHVFAAGMRDGDATATFTIKNLSGRQRVEVLDESRTLTAENGVFSDQFTPWAVHLYRIKR